MHLHDAAAVFDDITAALPLTDVHRARDGVIHLSAACEIEPDLADQLHDHLNHVESTIRIVNACI